MPMAVKKDSIRCSLTADAAMSCRSPVRRSVILTRPLKPVLISAPDANTGEQVSCILSFLLLIMTVNVLTDDATAADVAGAFSGL